MAGRLDAGELSAELQDRLRRFKIRTRIDNETYLRSHPEVEIMISGFLKDVLLKRPADIRKFAANHFTSTDLHVVIGAKVEKRSDPE